MRDLVIIGAGPGGYDAAIFAKEQGLDVVLIEQEEVGGTCLNWGCIPTKALYHNALEIDKMKHLSVFGIHVPSFDVDYGVIKERKETIVSAQVNNIHTSLKRLGIELKFGTASIVDPHTVMVNDESIPTKHIIIATGSSPRRFPFAGDSAPIVHDSKGILTLSTFPKRMIVVGAGVIGVEMASIFSAMGTEVTLVEFQSAILPSIDMDIQKRARNLYKRKGITIHTDSVLKSIVKSTDGYMATIESRKGTLDISTDFVLLATGRQPHFGGLALEDLGISFDAGGIHVNDKKQTSIPNIYAIGDVNGELMLAHKATYDGYKAISHILGNEMDIRFDLVPSVVFSIPEIASIGAVEQDLSGDYRTNKYLFKTNAKAECMNETDGFIKMIVDDNDHLIGCHIIGAHASDLIHEVAGLMYKRITTKDYRNIIHAHPTLSEVIGECLKGLH